MSGEARPADGFISLRKLLHEQRQWQADLEARGLSLKQLSEELNAPESAGRYSVPAIRPIRRAPMRLAAGPRSAAVPPRRQPKGAFIGGLLASAVVLAAALVGSPSPYAKWVHAALDGAPLDPEPAEVDVSPRPSPAARAMSADALARAIAQLRYETAGAKEEAPAPASPAAESQSPAASSAVLPAAAGPAIAEIASVPAMRSAEFQSAPQAPSDLLPSASQPAVSGPVPALKTEPQEMMARSAKVGQETPPSASRAAMIEQSQPRPTPEASTSRTGAQTTGSISRLGDGVAHLSGPSDPPAPVKKPPKKQQAAPKVGPQPGARIAQAKVLPQQPRIVVIVPPPPPPSPGLFGSIGNFFGF